MDMVNKQKNMDGNVIVLQISKMKYDKWITQEVILNCKHKDMWEYVFQLYIEMVRHELDSLQTNRLFINNRIITKS